MRTSLLILAMTATGAVYAQDAAASIAAIQRQYAQTKQKITAIADEMPEDGYTLVPGEGSRTFAGAVGHVADAQATTCGALAGTPTQLGASNMTAKADLVVAIKKSFDLCDVAYAGINPANHDEAVTAGFGGPQPGAQRRNVRNAGRLHSREEHGASIQPGPRRSR
jgi:hypothetical protein